MLKDTSHLHYPEGAALIAWHTSIDVCAANVDGSEILFFEGEPVGYDVRRYHHPTQMIINICHGDYTRAGVAQLVRSLRKGSAE
jgi:hypothetical protein